MHSVTFGGRHREGPMQTVGGIKGSQVLGFDEIANWAYQLLDDVSQVCSRIHKSNTSHSNMIL